MKPVRAALLLIVSLLLLSPAAHSDAYEEGLRAFNSGDFKLAQTLWLPLNDQGDVRAQYSLGSMYEKGFGVSRNGLKAMSFYLRAAENGLMLAQLRVGQSYLKGELSNRDYGQAQLWLKKAAAQGLPDAQYLLGVMAQEGLGQSVNLPQANDWFTQAAKAGYSSAQHSLAMNYVLGKGVNRDLKQAILWLEQSAKQGDLNAMRDLGFFYYQGIGLNQDFAKALYLLEPPAKNNSPLAQYLLGEIYRRGGNDINADEKKAIFWYQLADKNGYPDAKQRLKALVHTNTAKDRSKAALSNNEFDLALANNRARMLKLPPKHYTIQLFQVKNYKSLKTLIEQSYNDNQLYYVQIDKNGEDWYLVSYGSYPNTKSADDAYDELPAHLQVSQPWIRQIKQIHPLLQ